MAKSSNDARTRRVIEQAIRRAEGFIPRRMPKLTNEDRMAILRDGRAIDIAAARATRAAAESHKPRRCPNCGTVQPTHVVLPPLRGSDGSGRGG